ARSRAERNAWMPAESTERVASAGAPWSSSVGRQWTVMMLSPFLGVETWVDGAWAANASPLARGRLRLGGLAEDVEVELLVEARQVAVCSDGEQLVGEV